MVASAVREAFMDPNAHIHSETRACPRRGYKVIVHVDLIIGTCLECGERVDAPTAPKG